jgi:hypothetical protein
MPSLLETILLVLAACYVAEQIFYRIAGSYPYRYGFIVRTIVVPDFDLSYWNSVKDRIGALVIKTQLDKGEVYFRHKYPIGTIGPLVFLGQIKKNHSATVLQIRVGPLSALFVAFIIAYPFISLDVLKGPLFEVINLLSLAAVIAYFYFALLLPIRRAIGLQNDTKEKP